MSPSPAFILQTLEVAHLKTTELVPSTAFDDDLFTHS